MSVALVIRLAIVALLGVHAAYMYGTARVLGETFGFDVQTSLLALIFAGVMMIPFIWAYGLADLPEVYFRHFRPIYRWRRSRCPQCAYQMNHVDSGICPECGRDFVEPTPYRFGPRTARRFAIMVLISLFLGCVAGEAAILNDEHEFRREVEVRLEQGNPATYIRPRSWQVWRADLCFAPGVGCFAVGNHGKFRAISSDHRVSSMHRVF